MRELDRKKGKIEEWGETEGEITRREKLVDGY